MTRDRAHACRFLIVAPVGRDGELISSLLRGSGHASECAASITRLQQAESTSILGLILTDEALTGGGLEALLRIVNDQPDWSDLPVILLTSSSSEPRYAAIATRMRLEIRSLILLDRPVRKELLISAAQVASTSRLKHLEIREAAARQSRSDEALRNSEKLAVAGRLAATMAHEVNNPLEAIGNLLYLVENCSNLEEARSCGRLAVQELKRISEIIDRTLRFHRSPANPNLTEVSELAASALALFRKKLRERRIRENLAAPQTHAYCSGGEIRQALVNLIGNAVDAMPEGGTLYLRVSTVTVAGFAYARLTVADTGSGIHPEVRPNLFTQFFTTKGSRGTGLGLWLTRDIVQRNRGKLRFRSRTRAPSGTVFSIYLPAAAPRESVQPDESARPGMEAA